MNRTPLQLFGTGCAKTGTSSLARMFADHFRSAHEPEARALIDLIFERENMSTAQFRSAVKNILDPLGLEVNVSQLNGHIIDALVSLYPGAKFVLTVRDPESWLRSFTNHQRTRKPLPPNSPFARFRNLRFGGGETTDPNAIYPMEQYLRYWLMQNATIINAVPAERLLILRTENLDAELPRLAAFLGISENMIVRASANRGDYRDGNNSPFDDAELTNTARQYALRLGAMTGLAL